MKFAVGASYKGQVGGGNFLYLMIIFFIISVLVMLFYLIGQDLISPLNAIPGFNQTMCNIAINTSNHCYPISPLAAFQSIIVNYASFDNWLPYIFFAVAIAIIGSTILLPANFLALALEFIIMSITVFISFLFSNSARSVFLNPVFTNAVPAFQHTLSLWQNMPILMIVFMAVEMVVIGAKSRIVGAGGLNSGGGFERVRM